ncbi:MAG: hypothetical protein EXS05_10340 [Planctomycetaceae bacterium]|nr:hypothetical protein [Planctomycetaceae bacterium]
MWSIAGKPVPSDRFQPFEPVEVLYEFDGPRVFSVLDSDQELNLACWSDEDEQICRYVVAATTPETIAALRNGGISVYDALNQPRCWLCDVSPPGILTECRRVEFERIPRDALPAPGTLLMSVLESAAVDVEGRIRELDKDRLSFELREIEGARRTQRFVFDEDLLDDVVQAFQDDARVRVAGQPVPVKNAVHAHVVGRSQFNASGQLHRIVEVSSTDLLSTGAPEFDPNAKAIWEEIAEIVADVSEEELAKLPSDGAARHDVYIYGAESRE